MACNCFNSAITNNSSTLKDKIENNKCRCRSRYTVQENTSRFIIRDCSLTEIDKIKVDDFLFRNQSAKKCDYLFVFNDEIYIFVELKGRDLDRAVIQISETVESFHKEGLLNTCTLRAFIVSSRYPSNDSTYRRRKAEFEKRYSLYRPILKQKNMLIQYFPKTDSVV